MAPTYNSDDEDTQEHQAAPRYPDASPAAGEVQDQPAYPSQPADQPADAGPAAPWSAPTAPWPASGQQSQQTPQSGEPWQQQPAQPWQQSPQQPAQPWQQSPQQPPQGQWQQPPQGQWQGQQTGQSGWSAQPEYAGGGGYSSSPLVTIAAVVLLVFGLLTTLIGALGVAVGGFFEAALREASQQGDIPGLEEFDLSAIGDVIVVVFVIVLIIGILHLASAIGIFMHKQWARILGIVLAVLGTLLGVLGLVGASSAAGGLDGSELAVPIAMAVGYAFSLFALIAGGNHFRRQHTR